MPAPPRRRTPPSFQPRFSLALLYLFVLFFVYCFALIAPALFEVLQTVPPGPEQQQAAAEVARRTLRPRMALALAAALLTVWLGARTRLLPGLRSRG